MQVSQSMLDHFAHYEGIIPYMYKDSEHYVTIGCGHKFNQQGAEAPREVLNLNFIVMQPEDSTADQREASWKQIRTSYSNWGEYFRPFRQATQDEIKAEWKAIKQATSHYLRTARLGLFPGDIKKLFVDDVVAKAANLTHRYQKFDLFPSNAQLALLDLVYNTGPGGLDKFVEMNKLIVNQKNPDWKAVAERSHRLTSQIGEGRNTQIKLLFQNAPTNTNVPTPK